MELDEFNKLCESFVGTHHVVQWGNSDVWKVGEKVFAIGYLGKSGRPVFTFKVSHLNFEFLRDTPGYIPAPYFASRGMKWIQQTENSGELDEDLTYYLTASYRIVALGLSKRKQKELGLL